MPVNSIQYGYIQCLLKFILLLLFIFNTKLSAVSQQQIQDSNTADQYKRYDTVFKHLKQLAEINGLFQKAVFIVENTHYNAGISYQDFESITDGLVKFTLTHLRDQRLNRYNQPDSNNYLRNHSIYSALFDTLNFKPIDSIKKTHIVPYSYFQDDPLWEKDWKNMFVTKLLATRKGNCRSLAYLYKIIADKIGAKCWLSLAPNHIYIKNFSQQYGWYNTELTSRSFPTDAWIMASGYISADAIRSRLYMDTLSNQQSIGLCVLDLAKGYEYETKNYYDGFILKCCDLVLQYHATNPMALLLKAETLKKVYLKQKEENALAMKQAYSDMESAYITLARLHYREMPKEMYLKWVEQMQQQKNQ